MKLYYAPGACSLAPHIVAREAGLPLDLERVDIGSQPHRTASGLDFATVNPKGYVPALALDDGGILTEVAAIVQYLADLAPASGLAPAPGTFARVRLQEWLTFISSELHKMFSPWLFHPELGEVAARGAREAIAKRLSFLDARLAGREWLTGERFTVADAYAYTILGWSPATGIDLAPYPAVAAYLKRIAARPAVGEAQRAERQARAAAA